MWGVTLSLSPAETSGEALKDTGPHLVRKQCWNFSWKYLPSFTSGYCEAQSLRQCLPAVTVYGVYRIQLGSTSLCLSYNVHAIISLLSTNGEAEDPPNTKLFVSRRAGPW